MSTRQPSAYDPARCETLGQEITQLAAHLHAAIQAAMDELSTDEPTADELSADPPAGGLETAGEGRPDVCQRRADGLVLMAETLLEGGAKSSTSGREGETLLVQANVDEGNSGGQCRQPAWSTTTSRAATAGAS